MFVSGHLSGGASLNRKYKIGASIVNPCIVVDGTAGVGPCTTTDFADTPGFAIDTATYSTTFSSGTNVEGLVTVSVRPDLIIRSLMSGGATENTALTQLDNTSASATGVTVTDADVGSADMASGTLWCISGANVGQSRVITTHTSSTLFTVTVPFPYAIAVGDSFLFCPYSLQGSGAGGSDGVGNVQTSTLFTQADASIASGTGGVAVVYGLELNGRSDSYVLFTLQDHIFSVATV